MRRLQASAELGDRSKAGEVELLEADLRLGYFIENALHRRGPFFGIATSNNHACSARGQRLRCTQAQATGTGDDRRTSLLKRNERLRPMCHYRQPVGKQKS